MTDDQISIERHDEGSSGEYIAQIPGSEAAARLTWTDRGGVRHAEHTHVPHAMRGRGIAALLVEALVADARREGFRIAPDCSYVAAKFAENPDWADLRG